jgi:hypothetical protein
MAITDIGVNSEVASIDEENESLTNQTSPNGKGGAGNAALHVAHKAEAPQWGPVVVCGDWNLNR